MNGVFRGSALALAATAAALAFAPPSGAVTTYYYCNQQVAPYSPCPEYHSRRTFSYNKATNDSASIGSSVCQKITTQQGGSGVYGSGSIYTRTCAYNVVSSGSTCGGGGCYGYAFVGNNGQYTIPVIGEAHYL